MQAGLTCNEGPWTIKIHIYEQKASATSPQSHHSPHGWRDEAGDSKSSHLQSTCPKIHLNPLSN